MLIWLILENSNGPITLEVPCSLTLDAVPGVLDLYVYLNIEMAIVRLQWVSFTAMPSRTLNPLSVVTVGSMSGVSYHSVVEL